MQQLLQLLENALSKEFINGRKIFFGSTKERGINPSSGEEELIYCIHITTLSQKDNVQQHVTIESYESFDKAIFDALSYVLYKGVQHIATSQIDSTFQEVKEILQASKPCTNS